MTACGRGPSRSSARKRPHHLIAERVAIRQGPTRKPSESLELRAIGMQRFELAGVSTRIEFVHGRRHLARRDSSSGKRALPHGGSQVLRSRDTLARHPSRPSVEDRMRKVGVKRHDEASGSQLKGGRAHERMVGVVRKRRWRVDASAGREQALKLRRRRSRELVGLAVLFVEEVEVDRRTAGKRQRPAILVDALTHALQGVGRARVPIPPRRCAQARGHTGEDVDDNDDAGLREHVPTREHRVIEVGRKNRNSHLIPTIPVDRGATVNTARMPRTRRPIWSERSATSLGGAARHNPASAWELERGRAAGHSFEVPSLRGGALAASSFRAWVGPAYAPRNAVVCWITDLRASAAAAAPPA